MFGSGYFSLLPDYERKKGHLFPVYTCMHAFMCVSLART